ncbi:MAG: rhodanese-like domain-containing protein [Desulfobacteria bacterium]
MKRSLSEAELIRVWPLHVRIRSVLAFLLISLFAFSGQGHGATDPQAQALAQVQEEARKGNYRLIAPETIKAQFLKNSASLFLVDTRQEWEYQREHIRGAKNLPVTPNWWTQYSPWIRGEMTKLLGPDKKRGVVFY